MTILYLSHTTELYGSGNALFNIVQRLCSKEKVIVVLPRKGLLSEKLSSLGIECFFAPIRLSIYPPAKSIRDIILYFPRLVRMLIYNYISFLKVIKIIEKVRPDIIHTNVGPVHIGSFAARLKKIPHIWHIREFQDLHFGWIPFPTKEFLTKELNHPNNFKIAITNAIFNHTNLNIKAKVLYDGVFSTSNIPEINKRKKKYFLFVGILEDAKGINEAIEAFIEISSKYNDYQLLIAGSGNVNYVKMLQFKADKAMISEKVVFLGFRNDVYKLMAEASAILVCSRFEGFGFITAEAMFNGCLVIGKDTAGTKEQFDNGFEMWKQEIGIRYTENKELVLAIEEVCKNGIEPYLDTINKAQKTVVEMYSLEKNVQKLIDIYHEILN